ncbi:MAG TPA: hypothetical protein VHU84_10335 [Lacipirellulaceae bacterium]|jgi:ABC-type glycerol-3-phosphate transport system substrate-binding protein|nr:hypothetical protein [Lacipirellulaceae bacterium]
MKRILSAILMMGVILVGAIGCAEKSSSTTKKTVSTPNGETQTTNSTEVKKSGENPPPAQK